MRALNRRTANEGRPPAQAWRRLGRVDDREGARACRAEGSISPADEERLARQVAIRLSEEDIARLDALHARMLIASRNAIARAAMRIGLDALEAEPSRIFVDSPPPKRGRRARAVLAKRGKKKK